jgi:hypothetical protein
MLVFMGQYDALYRLVIVFIHRIGTIEIQVKKTKYQNSRIDLHFSKYM